jgi:hypothetical protein
MYGNTLCLQRHLTEIAGEDNKFRNMPLLLLVILLFSMTNAILEQKKRPINQ